MIYIFINHLKARNGGVYNKLYYIKKAVINMWFNIFTFNSSNLEKIVGYRLKLVIILYGTTHNTN